MKRIVGFLLGGLRHLAKLLLCLWGTLAIFYSNFPFEYLRQGMAMAFFVFAVWALWINRKFKTRYTFAGVFLVVLIWHLSISPSHDREWLPEVAVMPRAEINGDRVLISGYRDFSYRQWNVFDANYHDREVLLSDLTSLDFYVSYWKKGPIAHTFLSFNFKDAPPVCISIEIRPEVGEGFSPVASMFKQYELIYVVGEERDLVRSRTNFRAEDVYLYRIQLQPNALRNLFLTYMKRINELADRPEWYHLLKNNCTLNIIRYKKDAVEAESQAFDHRHLLNGWIDRYLYEAGYVDTSISFKELRKRSLINQPAKDTASDVSALEFSKRIRASLPGNNSSASLKSLSSHRGND